MPRNIKSTNSLESWQDKLVVAQANGEKRAVQNIQRIIKILKLRKAVKRK